MKKRRSFSSLLGGGILIVSLIASLAVVGSALAVPRHGYSPNPTLFTANAPLPAVLGAVAPAPSASPRFSTPTLAPGGTTPAPASGVPTPTATPTPTPSPTPSPTPTPCPSCGPVSGTAPQITCPLVACPQSAG